MRILIATMQLDIGGAETHIVELAKSLSRRGIEVIAASNGGAYVPELEEAGIRHIKVPFHSKNPACLHQAYRRLKQIIFENHIDVVHAHARIPAFICALLHKRYHFRFVTTAHWVFSTKFPYNLLTRWGDRSLAVSDDIKKYLIDNYGIPADNIRVTINGIDMDKFSADTDYSETAKEFNLLPDKTRIVYVSRMDTDRSYAAHKLIEVASDIANEIPNLEIIIVGGGNDYNNIKNEADAVNSAYGKRLIITTGSRTDINKFTASGSLFIGVSRAALEAMACEKPAIIAGNEGYIGIFDESKLQVAIDTNFCCRGCEETTAERLKQDILTVLKMPADKQKELGKYSRETVRNYYSVDTMADDAVKMYISIIKNSPINQVDIKEFDDIDSYLLTNPIRTSRGKIDVMVSGYYGYNNSGDDSILKAIVDSISANRPDARILALSNDPASTKNVYGIDAIHRFNFPRIVYNMHKTRLLISGGGSLIQDVTSDKSLAYYLWVINTAKRMGAKVMLYANGIGPIRHEANHKRIASVLNKADIITLREPDSLKELERFGVNKPETIITADPAFTLSAASRPEADKLVRRTGLPDGKKYCAVSIRPWKNADTDMLKTTAYIADYIKDKYGLEILFIPMQESKDMGVSKKAMSLMKNKGYILSGHPTPAQLLGIVGGAEFIIGMRLHILIYSAKMGIPVIGLTYDPKVDSAMKYLGQDFTVPVNDMNPLTLCSFVDTIMKTHSALSDELKAAGAESERKAEINTQKALELLDSCTQ